MEHGKLPENEAAAETPKKWVLIVDDEAMILKVLQRTILRMGKEGAGKLDVASASSVDEAVQMIQGGLEPAVILSDMMMPNKTGKDFLEWLEKEHPALVSRFCFVSAGATSQSLQAQLEYMRAMKRMIDKPFDADQIRDVIRSILGLE
jgi:CheY-like chemotaxis protein